MLEDARGGSIRFVAGYGNQAYAFRRIAAFESPCFLDGPADDALSLTPGPSKFAMQSRSTFYGIRIVCCSVDSLKIGGLTMDGQLGVNSTVPLGGRGSKCLCESAVTRKRGRKALA